MGPVAAVAPPAPASTHDAQPAEQQPREEATEGQPKRKLEPAEESTRKKGKGKGSKEKQKGLMTKTQFMESATPVPVVLPGGKEVYIPPKKFSTGSVGFWHGTKINLNVGGRDVTVQAQFNFAVIGSKKWAE